MDVAEAPIPEKYESAFMMVHLASSGLRPALLIAL